MIVSTFTSIRTIGIAGTPLVSAVIVFLSLLPSSKLVSTGLFSLLRDKGAHALAYAALGFFLYCAMVTNVTKPTWSRVFRTHNWRMLFVFGVSIILGSAIEIVQPHYGRSFEFLDIVADGIGALMGIAFGFIVVTIAMRRDVRRRRL